MTAEPVIDTARVLTPNKAMTIVLAPNLSTTLLFPAQVASISGYGIAPAGQAGGVIELTYPPGSPLICLRALNEFARVMMTVMIEHKLYVFDLRTGPRPDAAITFVRPGGGDAAGGGGTITAQQVVDARPVSSDASLISYLLLAKESDGIRDGAPELYQDYATRPTNYISDNNKIKTVVTKVHRWSKPDVTVLEGTATNETDHDVQFDGRVTSVEIANELHPAKLTEGLQHPIPAHQTVPLNVVLQGDYDGGRLGASIDNEFRIILADPEGGGGSVWGLKNGRPLTGKVDGIPPVEKAQLIPTLQSTIAKEGTK